MINTPTRTGGALAASTGRPGGQVSVEPSSRRKLLSERRTPQTIQRPLRLVYYYSLYDVNFVLLEAQTRRSVIGQTFKHMLMCLKIGSMGDDWSVSASILHAALGIICEEQITLPLCGLVADVVPDTSLRKVQVGGA